MDPGGPGSRAGRTFWTFWNYITDIVGRFLRPEPRGTEINDTDKTNSTPTNDEPLDSCHKIHTTTEEGEEVHVVLASSVGSTRPVVLWDTGSELQPEISQNVLQEHEKINENNDGKREEEIETGIDAASYLPISTTMDNPEQSCDITINDEELMPKILVDSRDEMIDRDIEVCSEGDKPQSKEQPNEISKSFNEQNTYSEITSELDTITFEQKHCEQHDEKLRLNDNMDLDESAQMIEKQENVEVDGNVKSECGGNKNAEKGAEEKEIKIEMCLQTTHLEVTRQNDVTDRSNEMNNEDMNRPHTLVLEAEKFCKQDNMSEVFESSKDEHYNDNMTNQNAMFDTEDGDDVKECKECPVLCTTDDSANVKSENYEKENEIQKEEIEIKENDNDHMTNQNTTFDTGDGDNAHTSLVLETENMNKQDDKNVVHGGNKDDIVMTQNNPDMGNLERLSDVGSSVSDKDHVIVLEEDEKQELTVANTTDANVKLENYEKEKEIQKEEIEMTENENDQDRDQDMTQQCTLEVADDENSTEESTNEDDLNKLHMSLVLETENRSKQDDKKEDEKQELTAANTADDSANVKSENDEKESEIQKEESEITEHYNDNMTNQNAVSDTEDGDNAKETCPALILDQDMTQQYTLEVVDNESSTEESKDMNEDDLNKLHTLVLETENMIKEDDKNEVHDGNKDVLVMTQNNPDMGNLEISCHCADKDLVIVLEEDEKQEFTVANTTDDTAIVKSENDEKGKEIQKEDSEITKQYDNMTTQNAMADIEYGDSAKETCPVLNIDQDMSHPYGKSSTEQSKDMNKDYLNKLHIFGGLETETLSILDNQDEYNKEQVTDERVIIQEVEPSTSKQEYTAANGNEESFDNRENKKPGNMEQDISEEESDNNDSKTKVIRSNMDDSANVGLETVSRCDLDLESFFSIAHPASSEMDSSMGKFCVTIKNEGGPTQEQVIAFKNIPPGEGEGQEHPYSYKESREEVPDCNNECNNQSATQSFLEVGNCRENQTTLLQEEVESRAVKRLQNSGTSEGEDTLGDLMETELIQNSLEEHIADTHLPDYLMKTGSEYTNFETNFVSEEVEEKEDDLKEAEREIGFEMGKGLCDTDSVKDGLETGFQNCIFLDQNECNIQTVERPFVEMQTTEMDLSAIEEGLFTSEEEATVVKRIIDGSSESVKSGSVNEDVDVHEHCTTGSNDNVMPDVVHYEISVNALSVKDEHQKCVLQHQIFDDVIEDEILDLWIQHTSVESSEVHEGDQGHEDSQRDLPEEEKIESIPELSITCDVSLSLSVTESGFFDLSMDMGSIQHECNEEAKELQKEEEIINVSCALNKSEDLSESSIAELELETAWREDMGTTPKSTNVGEEAITSQNIDSIMSMLTPVMQDNSQFSIQTDYQPFTTSGMLSEPETLSKDQSDSLSEIKNTFDTTVTSETKVYQSLLQDKLKVEALQESEVEDINKVNISEFDFTPQKSRIAVKNPRVRPPKDFRSLLHKPSLEPSPSKPLASCVPAGVPMGGLGIGIKLPGLGTGFPVLKKTRKTIEEETKTTTQETKPMLEEEDKLKPEDSQQRPKWMPPNQPGFGNPLMSELKSKLKKTTKE